MDGTTTSPATLVAQPPQTVSSTVVPATAAAIETIPTPPAQTNPVAIASAATVIAPATIPQAPIPPVVPEALSKINRDLKEKAVFEQARRLNFGYMDIEKTPMNPDLATLLPKDQALSALLVPFFRVGKKLRIALWDPQSPATASLINALQQQGYLLNINLSSDEGLRAAIQRLYENQDKAQKLELVTQVNEAELQAYEQEIQHLSELKTKLSSLTAEQGLNLIYVGAIKTGSSDIHFQPEETEVTIRFRIDGILQKIFDMDLKTFANLTNQIKYKAGMKLNINNVPQDGRFHFILNNRKIDVRVSSLPTEFGETFVLRLLDSGRGFLTFEESGFIGRNLKTMNRAIKIAHGMILVTGPTGSGKTTTLYSMLNAFNTPEKKVITLEDPIEYHLKGISQSQINEKRDYDFATGLRSILRQDPDVVMVGEIRDHETAETASQAALTGHVVLSTLHTNSAIETIPRLINIGLKPFMVAPSLHMVISQRLVRQLCQKCRISAPITETERRELETVCTNVMKVNPEVHYEVPDTIWHPGECESCSHTGYSGRLGIHEILLIDEPIRRLIMEEASSNDVILKARSQGMVTMREDGMLKVIAGHTTMEEVQRVTQLL